MFARLARKATTDSPAGGRPEAEPPVRLPRSRGSRMTGRLARSAAALVVAAAAFAVVTTATSAHAAGPATRSARVGPVANVSVIAAPAHPAVAGRAGGWSGPYTYNVAPGLGGLFYHLTCPSGQVPQSGGFQELNVVAGDLGADGLWTGSDNSTWLWYFKWPGGAPSGESINFEVNCA